MPSVLDEPHCKLSGKAEKVRVRRVVDGDTVHLVDGRKIRFIAVNTTELNAPKGPIEPLAVEAKLFLQSQVSGKSLSLQPGLRSKDRHGRTLAHLFLDDGTSLEALLLIRGLGFLLVMPPNLNYQKCLQQAEQWAREQYKGVWNDPYFKPVLATNIKPSHGGYRQLTGRVASVSYTSNSWWIDLQGELSLLIDTADQTYFSKSWLNRLKDREIVVSGWMVKRKLKKNHAVRARSEWLMKIRHPAAIRLRPVSVIQ